MRACLWLALCWCLTATAADFTPPLGAEPTVGGERTQMLNLGSTHLSGHTDQWQREWLEPLLRRLQRWQPTLITVEGLSGAQCEMMRQDPARFGEVFDSYCRDVSAFQRALALTQAQADLSAAERLRNWPETPTAADRRQLLMLFLAAGEPASAMVQWLQLAEGERVAGDTLTDDAVDWMRDRRARLNESYDVGSELAARLGLERVYAVDDHTSDVLYRQLDPAYGPWQEARFAAIRESDAITQLIAREGSVVDGDSLLNYYRQMNAAGAQDAQVRADFGGAMADAHPRFGRLYAGWWETRNLRMMANFRELTAAHPGARVLNIVGASLKPWYDQWARQFGDVSVVDVAAILGR